ncbi:MAG TPA: DegT/DnrJ/EryC1/StrS aminotransferase family protein [Coriobacteriia bacterium]
MADKLAIDGGTPVRSTPMPGWPSPSAAQIDAVTAVLRAGTINYWTGTEGRRLEREYAQKLGRSHAIAVANGTLALELALRGFGIGPGDEVVVPARSFIATASCVIAVGATPVFADIDPESSDLTAETLEAVLTERTAAVIVVHVAGWPAEMGPITDLARSRGILVIEDCAQAHGAAYRGRPVGAFGDAACFSFCQDKIVAAGEGGLLVLDDDAAFALVWAYRDHGTSMAKLSDRAFVGRPASFRWIHDTFGSNYRLPELEAAMVRAGERELPAAHARRTELATRLARGVAGVRGIRVPLPAAHCEHAFYRLYAHVEPTELAEGWDRDKVLFAVAAEGVPVQYGSCAELYREEAFVRAGLAPATPLPGAAHAHETSLAFFVHPTLSDDDIDDVIAAVRKVMEAAAR